MTTYSISKWKEVNDKKFEYLHIIQSNMAAKRVKARVNIIFYFLFV